MEPPEGDHRRRRQATEGPSLCSKTWRMRMPMRRRQRIGRVSVGFSLARVLLPAAPGAPVRSGGRRESWADHIKQKGGAMDRPKPRGRVSRCVLALAALLLLSGRAWAVCDTLEEQG